MRTASIMRSIHTEQTNGPLAILARLYLSNTLRDPPWAFGRAGGRRASGRAAGKRAGGGRGLERKISKHKQARTSKICKPPPLESQKTIDIGQILKGLAY